MPESNYHLFPLAISLRIASEGVSGDPAAYTFVDLPVPRGMSEALLKATSVEVIYMTKGGPPNNELEWNLELIFGLDRDNEATSPVEPLGATNISENGPPLRSSPYTTVSNLLPHCRARLRARNKANTAGVRSALVWVIVMVKVSN